jgi:UDP-N-acetylmuramoylalanine--D-glutamate ligase
MELFNNLKNKRVTVMGLGLHGGGLAVVKWLLQKKVHVLITDLRRRSVLLPSIKKINSSKVQYVLGKHRVRDFIKTDMIIKNPGVPRDSKFLRSAMKNNIPIETDMSIFFRLCHVPLIGITGTKGKSTTTTLIYEIFKKAKQSPLMGGNIRISPFRLLPLIQKKTPVILELSSWQLEDMKHIQISPHISVITNILPDHLNRYKNINEYTQSKKLIFKWQKSDDFIVLNRLNPGTRQLGTQTISQRYWYATKYFKEENGTYIKNNKIYFRRNGEIEYICNVSDIRLPGPHNINNALAAITVAKISHLSNYSIKQTLNTFKGVPDRLELFREYRTRRFVNDTTATAPDAAIAALQSFSRNSSIILLAGGYDKKLTYQTFARTIKNKAAFLILFKGSATIKLIRELKTIKFSKYMVVSSMQEAVTEAYAASRENSIILLSPGAASFGIFLNEFDRGRQFKKEVSKLT